MKNVLRDIDGFITLFLKLIFVYDIVYYVLMKPIELSGYKRYSDALIASKEKDPKLHMSVNGTLLKSIREKDFLKDDTAILLALKNGFIKGLLKLEFNKNTVYKTEVNEAFYRLIKKDLAGLHQYLQVEIVAEVRRRQMVAKLLLISSSYLWNCLIDRRMKDLLLKVNREEIVKIIEIRN
ncbi:hypothetical protein [Rhodonellum sp.]|uniref:hypothetical protein n=1 Tax=Rhodonellum sp. TaxID=2231180 RepID=UPI00271AE5D9|nr:hypothetical protein [Rhodonellum sp.]MDO9554238.1 hypothetical protein [Rhodonellum sp.]